MELLRDISRTARRASAAVALGLLAVGLVAAAPASAAPTWLSPTSLSSTEYSSYGPQVVIQPGGEAVVVWYEGSGTAERVRGSVRSTAGTWSATEVLSGPGGLRPDLALGQGGNATAIWELDAPTASYTEASMRSGGVWPLSSEIISDGAPELTGAYFPRLAANAGGEAVAVWQQCYAAAASEAEAKVKECFEDEGEYVVRASVRRGGVWSTPKSISDQATENAVKLQTAIAPNGAAVAIWENEADNTIHAATVPAGPAGSATWNASKLSKSLELAGEPQVAFDAAGNATALWHARINSPNSDYVVYSSTLPAGGSWSPQQPVSLTDESAFAPQLAVSPGGAAVAIWTYNAGGTTPGVIQGSVRSGSSWSLPKNVSAEGQEVGEPRLGIDPNGNAVAVWRRSNGANKIVQGAELPAGGGWTAPQDISAAGQDAKELDVAVDTQGNAVATWHTEGTSKVVQAAGLDAAGPLLNSLSIPGTGTAGTPVSFSVSPLDVWSALGATGWSFGDGATGSGTAPSHTYASAGSYTVTVTGTDALGNAASASGTITVAAASKDKKGSDEGTASAAKVAEVKGGKALLKLSCNKAGPCSGVVKLLAKIEGKKALIGKKSFSIPAGKSRTVKVALNKKGKDKLRRSSHHRFTATLTGSGVKHRTVVLEGS